MEFNDLEVFTNKGRRTNNLPLVNFVRLTSFIFNSNVKMKVENFNNVKIYYSKNKKCIGFEFLNDNNEITIKRGKSNLRINSKSFFKHYDIKNYGNHLLQEKIINGKTLFICYLEEI